MIRKKLPNFIHVFLRILLIIVAFSLSTLHWTKLDSIDSDEKKYKEKRSFSADTLPRYFLNSPTPVFASTIDRPNNNQTHHIDTTSPWQLVKDEFNKMPAGYIMFNPPREMTDGKTERLEARITENLNEKLTEGLKGRGAPQIESVQIAPYMKVSLKGEKFNIESLNSEAQPLTGQYTEWAWNVTPKEAGSHSLILVVAVRIKIRNDGEETKDCRVLEKEINVKVSPLESAKKLLKFSSDYWVVLSALVAAIIWAYRKYRKLKTDKRNKN